MAPSPNVVPTTGRSLPEWIGRTPDSVAPPRVRIRVFERAQGKCHKCQRKINAGEKWTLEHLVALINGGENRETNLGVTCDWCLPGKNAEDVAEKSKVYRVKARDKGIKRKSRFACSKDGPYRKKLDGTVERR